MFCDPNIYNYNIYIIITHLTFFITRVIYEDKQVLYRYYLYVSYWKSKIIFSNIKITNINY